MTKGTTVNPKAPFVALERLRPQDVAGLKSKCPKYKTTRSPSTKGTRDSYVKGHWLKEQPSLSPSTKGTHDSYVTGDWLKEQTSLSPSTKDTRDNCVKGHWLKEQTSVSPSTKGTRDSYVKGHWLKEQDGTTFGGITVREDGAQGATKDGESCLPAGEEGSNEHHCFRCSTNFPNSDTLVLHLKSHSPVKRSCTLYEKEVCGSSLDNSSPLKRTMTSTSKQRGSSLTMGKKTKFEKITSSGGSRFKCNVCSKVFMQSNRLKLHMRTHSENKTDKEHGTDSFENSQSLDTAAFVRMMKNVIQETAIKCFTDALVSDTLPLSSDEAVDHVRIHAQKALEQYCSNSNGLVDLKQQKIDDLEHILQNLNDGSLDIKKEGNDGGSDGESDKNIISVNSHNERFSVQMSLLNHQPNIKDNSEDEGSAGVSEHPSASVKHRENIEAGSVTDSVTCSVQNVIESKTFTAVTRNVKESTKFTENVQNVFENKICTPHKSSVPDTEKDITKNVNSNREPGQSNTGNAKTSEGGENTTLTTCQQLMLKKSKQSFSCHVCHKVFTLQSHLNLHQRTDHGTKQSKQNIDVHFSEDTDLQEHKDEDSDENEQHFYQCNIKSCGEVFIRERDFKIHLNSHQNKGFFYCSLCDKVFPAECLLKLHEKSHSEDLLYSCTKCEKAYEQKKDLLLHISYKHPTARHSRENPNKIIKEPLLISPHAHKCLKCNIQFIDKNTYELHCKSGHTHVPISRINKTPNSTSGSHTGVSLHVCMKCNLQFANGTTLKHHLRTCQSVVEKEKALDCSNCCMKFPDDVSLEHHMKLNHSRLLLKCTRCDLKFPSVNALQSHMKDHGTQSSVGSHSECSKCHLKFSNDALLKRHMKLCHSVFQTSNQHICSTCGKKFQNQALLVHHTTLIHSPELQDAKKVLTCSACGMKFSDDISFHSHMKQHTSVVQKSTESCDVAILQNASHLDAQVISMQKDKLQIVPTSMDSRRISFQSSKCDMQFNGGNELQPHMTLHHASGLESQYSEVNNIEHGSVKNLQASPKLSETQSHVKLNHTPLLQNSKKKVTKTSVTSLQTHMKLNHTPLSQNSTKKVTKTSVTEVKQTSVQNAVPSSLQNINMQHSPMHESTNVFKCLRCQKQFYTSSQFRSHLRTHRRIVCPQCGKSFTTRNALIKHMCLESCQLLYKCDRCTSQFSSSVLFKKHLKWHDPEIHKAIEGSGNTWKQTKTGNATQFLGAAESFQNTPDSATTSHDYLVDEDVITVDDDIIIPSDENIVNKENHNTDEVQLNKTDDEIMAVLDGTNPSHFEELPIMAVLDGTNPNHFKELPDKRLINRTPKLSIGVQTEVVLSHESTTKFLTDHRNETSSDLHTADVRSFKRVPLGSGSAVSNNDSFDWHEGVDHSGDMLSAEIVKKATVSSRKLSSSVGRRKSPDISSAVCSINEKPSDSQDSVQLVNDEILKKSPKAPLISSKRKSILKDANQLVGSTQKKRRVSFADDISKRESDTCMFSEDMERTMPIFLPEKMTIDTNNSIASQKHVKYLKSCYVSLTRLEDSMLGSIANKVTTGSNKYSSEDLHKSRVSPSNRICGGRESDDKDPLQKLNGSLKTSDEELCLSVEANNTSPSKENKLGTRTLLHYFHYENVVNNSCEKENGQIMSKSFPMATSTPLANQNIRTTHTSIHSAKGGHSSVEEDRPVGDMGPQTKLGLSCNISHHSENRSRTGISIKKEKLEPLKRSTYTLKNKPSRLTVGRFKCKFCGKIFQFLPHYRVHKKTHAGQLIHKCPICNDRFPVRFQLGLHIVDHFEKGIPQMIGENKRPSNKSDTNTSKNFSPFQFPKRKLVFTTQAPKPTEPPVSDAFSHSSNVSTSAIDRPTNEINISVVENNLLPYSSNKDHSSALPLISNSNESNRIYSPDKESHQCDDSLGHSPRSEKNNDLEFACGKCNKKFTELFKLKLHQSIHTGVGLYKCSYCDMMFYFKNSLLSHVRTHSGEKKYACKYCGRQFDEYSVMLGHRGNHEVCGPFKCPECRKTFAMDSSLAAHMQLHVDRAWYKCTFCNWSFGVKSKFQCHVVSHSQKRPFICKVCKSSFKRMYSCHIHVKQFHIAKNEITLKSTRSVMDFIQIDKRIYRELQDFIKDITKKATLVSDGKSQMKSIQDTTALTEGTVLDGEINFTIDKELPEPILVDPWRLQDSSGKEICKAQANSSLSDMDSATMDKKDRYEKLCVEVRNVLMRMKRYPQIPIMSRSQNHSYLKIPTRQIQYPRPGKSLNLSENRSPNYLADTSKDKQERSGNLNKLAHTTPSPTRSIVQKSPEGSVSLDKQHNKTVQIQTDVIASSIGQPCKYGGDIFSKQCTESHKQIHTVGGDKLCLFCGKGFTSVTGLRYHMAHHADVGPYPCTICSRTFKLKHQMYSHLRKHSNEAKHTCKICSKSFFFEGNLQNHIFTHTKPGLAIQV